DEPPPPRPAIVPPSQPPVHPPVKPPVPVPVPKPLAMPAAPAQAGAVWIQFAALSAPASVARLQGDLRRAAGIEAVLSDVADPQDPSRTLQRVRLGPFATPRAARARLEELKPHLAGLALKPYVDRGGDPASKPPRRRDSR
ncbi:MAG: SPOR domain-containing protein, partial [Holophaga sp.]|nr:SPOR domain-containing protein [Holophaga sp.]